jgi:hypothetical protein
LPQSGSNSEFSYFRSVQHPEAYVVYPNGQEENRILVSESFLQLTMRSTRLTDEQRLTVLNGYPNMTAAMYDNTMNNFFPDSSVAVSGAYPERAVQGTAGNSAIVSQDSLASPYVRVSVLDANGQASEFSMARMAADQVLNNPNLSADDKIKALAASHFRLPEEARKKFAQLSKEELREMVAKDPDLARQEFMKMRAVYKKEGIELKPPPMLPHSSGTVPMPAGGFPRGQGPGETGPALRVFPGPAGQGQPGAGLASSADRESQRARQQQAQARSGQGGSGTTRSVALIAIGILVGIVGVIVFRIFFTSGSPG